MAEYQTEMTLDTPKDAPDVPQSEAALVNEWLDKVKESRDFRKKTFDAMRKSQDFAMRGADKEWAESGKYTVPILPRYINQAVATLYARNPQTTFERRKRLKYRLWDGRSDSLQAAMQMAAMGDPQAMALISEVVEVRQQDMLLDKMGETLQIVWDYYLNEQSANYKQQLKAAVRRVKTCKVAWIKLGFQRMLEPRPETVAQINDVTTKLARVKQLVEKAQADELDEMSAQAEELANNLEDLKRDEFMVVREGPVLDFPRSDQVIVDKDCVHLKSLAGARFIAQEYQKTPEEGARIWGVDIGGKYTAYDPDGRPFDGKGKKCARFYEVQDKDNLQVFVIAEGYPGFVKKPASPDVWMERFWSLFPIVFNEVEHYEEIYPLSDCEQAAHIQREYNRSREQLRQHRIAARPYYVTSAPFDEAEKGKLADHADHEIITLPTMAIGEDVSKIIQRGPTASIDPNLYEVEQHFNDLLRVVGYQEAQIGATSGATATESSIAQQSQTKAETDNTDDLDEVMAELARAAGQVMLLNLAKDTVLEIAGEGAVWPDTPTTREEAAKELMLKVEAGSTGRPNKAAELANLERAVPLIQQFPGVNPAPIAKKYLTLLDIDVEEGTAEGLPSITAMNAIIAKAAVAPGAAPTGDPRSDPGAQGVAGATNAPGTQTNEPGPQPAYTPPA